MEKNTDTPVKADNHIRQPAVPKNIKKIAVVGAGGIGGWLVSLLYDYGVNREQFNFVDCRIDVYDDDIVDLKNLLHANYFTDDIGRYKVEIMAERYGINGVPRKMQAQDFTQYHLIMCCVDNMPFRKSLYQWFVNSGREAKKGFIDGRCTSRQGAIFHSLMSDTALMKFINDSTESGSCLLDFEKENNISHVLPVVVASIMMQNFLNMHRKETSLFDGIFQV